MLQERTTPVRSPINKNCNIGLSSHPFGPPPRHDRNPPFNRPFHGHGSPFSSGFHDGGAGLRNFPHKVLTFRILCSEEKVGGVIGNGGSIIKGLQNEIPCEIKVLESEGGSEDRIITISGPARTAWMGAFYMCIRTGIALGYVYGGVMGGQFGWRSAFFVEAFLMLPFAILGFVMKLLHLKGFSTVGSEKAYTAGDNGSENQGGEHSRTADVAGESSRSSAFGAFAVFGEDMKSLLVDQVYVVNVLGYIAYNFVKIERDQSRLRTH